MFQTVSGEAYAPVADFQVSADTLEYQQDVAFAKLGDGGFVAVWSDSRFAIGSMRMQRFDLNGVKVGSEIVLPAGSTPALASTPTGGFLLTWTVMEAYPANSEVKARFYDSNLNPTSPEIPVNTTTDAFQENKGVAALAGGGYVITWGQRGDGGFDHVRAQILDSAGNKIGGEIIVSENVPGNKYEMGLTALAGGGFVAAWSGFEVADEFGNLSNGLRAQVFDSAGNKVGAAFSLNTIVPGTQSFSELAALPTGGFVAAWADDGGRQSGGPGNGNQGVWVQLFDSLGQKVGAALRLGPAGDGPTSFPTIAVTETGFIVTWPRLANVENGQTELRAQRFDFDGNKIAEEFVVGSSIAGGHFDPTNIVLDSGAILLGWTHRPTAGFNYEDVRAQLLFPVVHGTEGEDGFSGTASRDFFLGKGGDDFALGAAGDDNLDGGDGDDALNGEAGDDVLDGGAGDDRLDGGSGADMMSGGDGNDTYFVDESGDSITESFGRGIDTVMTPLQAYVLPANVENLVLTYAGTDTGGRVHGNGLNNIITGSGTHDLLKGLGGDDILIGGAGGIDSFEGAHGNDLMIGGDVSATNLLVNGSFETQDGANASSEYILASPTEDNGLFFRTAASLWGWQSSTGGGFRLDTGGGTNQSFNTGEGKVALDLETAGGNQTIFQDVAGLAAGTSLLLTFTAAYPTTGPASASFEVLWNGVVVATINPAQTAMTQYGVVVVAAAAGTGASGANRLAFREIGAGADGHGAVLDKVSLNAVSFDVVTGTGNANWVIYDSEFDGGSGAVRINLSDHDAVLGGVLVPAGHGIDTHGTIDTYVGIGSAMVADEGNNWALGTESYNFLVGGNGNDVLNGAGGDDFIDGNRGDDTLIGGTGDDIFLVHNSGDVVVENAGEGFDQVRAVAATFSIFGTHVESLVSLYGIGPHDFRGNSIDNVLGGHNFDDILRLQDGGDDTALGYGGNDVFLFGATLTAADKVYAGDGRDQIVIQGNYAMTLGSDLLDLESIAILNGADTRFGDPGTNSYDYDLTTLDVNVAPGVQMIVDASGLRPGEDLRFDGSAENWGSFFIYGGRGVDTLTGGSGNDAFYFGEGLQFGSNDVVDGGPGGIDQLGLRGSYTVVFGANQLVGIENIGLVSAQDTRFGPMGASYNYNLTMADGNVVAGAQLTLDAFALRAGESVSFNGAAETDGTYRIFGGQGHDNIIGGQGNDTLAGNRGADNLTGGGGADTFRYNASADSTPDARDHIHDFAPGIDKIDLIRIDADTHTAGDQAFHWIGANAFTGSGAASAGELRAWLDNGNWFIEGDTNGDGLADLRISMTEPAIPIGQGDFLL